MSPEAGPEVTKILNSGFIGQGQKVEEFENKLRDYFSYNFINTLNSGTSALTLALRLLKKPGVKQLEDFPVYFDSWPGLKEGDEVLTTPVTCLATNFPILDNGLKIKWVDMYPYTCNMDLDDLARKISRTTKVIMVVHWGGNPVDLERLREIQQQALEKFGFKPAIIEDCAHSFGSTFKGKKIGTHGNLACFSLQAIKHLTSVDGGLLISPHKELHDRAKLLRWYGLDRSDSSRNDFRCASDVKEYGYKFHMNDVNATIGMANLGHINDIISKYKDNAAFYTKHLAEGVSKTQGCFNLESASWLYTIAVNKRDDFIRAMKDRGVQTSRVHERNDKNTCFDEFKAILPGTDELVEKMVCIPVHYGVSEEDRQYVVDMIKKGW